MKILFCWLVVSLPGVGIATSIAQTGSGPGNVQTPYTVLGTCEENISALSNAHHLAGEDGTIIAIARLGDGERNRELNSRRLHNVRMYLTEFDWHRPPQTLITAEGKSLKGYGRVELYVRGVLFAVLQVKRNQDLLVGSCEPDNMRPVKAERNLYPYLDRKPGRSTKKP